MKTITLPNPQKDLQFPLMKALELRRTKRKWTDSPLSLQEISNILWAACGVNQISKKEKTIKRTAPSACNSQEIKVYVAIEQGVFLYDERAHTLKQTIKSDIREYIGTQKMMQSAPLALIFVSDYAKLTNLVFTDDIRKMKTSAVDTGFISQNVYLYCAAANLSTAVLGLVDRGMLEEMLNLNTFEKVVYTQVIGKTQEDFNSLDLPIITSQEEFDIIFFKFYSKSNAEIERTVQILKELPADSFQFIQSRITDIITLMNGTQNPLLKRFLPELVSKIELSEKETSSVWNILKQQVLNSKEGKLIRVNSIESLFVISDRNPSLRKDFYKIVDSVKQENIASINARLQKLGLI